jgi:hypothetical protein
MYQGVFPNGGHVPMSIRWIMAEASLMAGKYPIANRYQRTGTFPRKMRLSNVSAASEFPLRTLIKSATSAGAKVPTYSKTVPSTHLGRGQSSTFHECGNGIAAPRHSKGDDEEPEQSLVSRVRDVLAGERVGEPRAASAECAAHFTALIDSTWIVLVLVSSVPVTLTFCAANCSGVRWSLSA